MRISMISDLHGFYPKLPGGDLLIVAGDLTARDTDQEHLDFITWLALIQGGKKPYRKIVYIAGNHDNFLDPKAKRHGEIKTTTSGWNIEYLCDSGTEFEGLKVWGSPWTKTFDGMNPACKAFTCDTEEELAQKWLTCPNDVDILIMHTPPHGILDMNDNSYHCGSHSLRKLIFEIKPALLIFGHIHEQGNKTIDLITTFCVNASYVDKFYNPRPSITNLVYEKTRGKIQITELKV